MIYLANRLEFLAYNQISRSYLVHAAPMRQSVKFPMIISRHVQLQSQSSPYEMPGPR